MVESGDVPLVMLLQALAKVRLGVVEEVVRAEQHEEALADVFCLPLRYPVVRLIRRFLVPAAVAAVSPLAARAMLSVQAQSGELANLLKPEKVRQDPPITP